MDDMDARVHVAIYGWTMFFFRVADHFDHCPPSDSGSDRPIPSPFFPGFHATTHGVAATYGAGQGMATPNDARHRCHAVQAAIRNPGWFGEVTGAIGNLYFVDNLDI
jgi:hypothetical protein